MCAKKTATPTIVIPTPTSTYHPSSTAAAEFFNTPEVPLPTPNSTITPVDPHQQKRSHLLNQTLRANQSRAPLVQLLLFCRLSTDTAPQPLHLATYLHTLPPHQTRVVSSKASPSPPGFYFNQLRKNKYISSRTNPLGPNPKLRVTKNLFKRGGRGSSSPFPLHLCSIFNFARLGSGRPLYFGGYRLGPLSRI